jgi:hypothetical protein
MISPFSSENALVLHRGFGQGKIYLFTRNQTYQHKLKRYEFGAETNVSVENESRQKVLEVIKGLAAAKGTPHPQ